jgi:hypothetical protein
MPIQDMGWARIKSYHRQLSGKKAEVGLLDNSENMATVAAYQEWGTIHIPERPFMRSTIRKNHTHYLRLSAHSIRMMNHGGLSPVGVVERSAHKVMEDIQKSIIDWSSPPNAASTIRIKGKNDPLVNTGLMWVLVKYKLI